MKLFLDDIQSPQTYSTRCGSNAIYKNKDEWDRATNYEDFIHKIKNPPGGEMYSVISFDHDLDDEHATSFNVLARRGTIKQDLHLERELYGRMDRKCGYHCAKYLVDYCIDQNINLPLCVVHGTNVMGGLNILYALADYDTRKKAY